LNIFLEHLKKAFFHEISYWVAEICEADPRVIIKIAYFLFRCNVFVGLGYTLVARNEVNQSERQQLLSKAEHHYKAALKLDSFDYIGEFYLAMHYAETRRPTEAMEAANRALFLNSEHLSTLQLTILLLSGKKQFNEALDLTDSVLVEYPDSLGLLTLKVRLSEVVHGSEIALIGAKEMLYVAVERMQADEQLEGTNGGPSASTPTIGGHERGFAGLGGSNTEPTLGYGTIHSGMRMFDTMSDKDSVSLHAHSMTASHIERTMSEVASSLSSQFPPRPGGSLDPTYSLMRIWLLCAELHLRQDNIVDAELCTQEAKYAFFGCD
jgi:tetratricopeptide (TPR) repeat protein